MRPTPLVALAALALALALAVPAAAQQGPTLYLNQPYYGSIVGYDQPIWGRGRFKTFWVDLQANQPYHISMESSSLDAYVVLARAVNGVTEVLGEDDDGGGGTNAALQWTAPVTGRYLIIAQSYRPDDTGSFALRVQHAAPAAPPPPPPAEAIRVGGTAHGQLGRGDLVMNSNGASYDAYRFDARGGQRLIMDLRSSAFDPVLIVGRGNSVSWQGLATNDDGEGTAPNSRIHFVVPSSGTYHLYAAADARGRGGAYSLSVTEAPPAPGAVMQPLPPGATATGTVGEGDAILGGTWTYYDLYEVEGVEGGGLHIEAASPDFPVVLEVGVLNRNGSFNRVGRGVADRAGATVTVRSSLLRRGTYHVRVLADGDRRSGRYTLTSRMGSPTTPNPTRPAVRDTVRPIPLRPLPVDSAGVLRPPP